MIYTDGLNGSVHVGIQIVRKSYLGTHIYR